MNYIVNILFYILATFFCIKTIFYGIYEFNQKNTLGGISITVFSVIAYILFIIMMLKQ